MDEFVCLLCAEENKNLIPVASSEGIELQISTVLITHFPSCFQEPPIAGCICRCCWGKVEPFHQFYLIVSATHQSFLGHEINVNFNQKEEPFDHIKVEQDEADNTFYVDHHSGYSLSPLPETNEKVAEPEKRKRGRPKKIRKTLTKDKKIIPKSAGCKLKLPYVADELGMFRCEQCNLPFLSGWKLHKHVKEIHMALPFKCAEKRCVESYTTQEEADRHFNDKHSRIKCPHCNIDVCWNGLQRHIEKNHDKKKEVLCAVCGLVCKSDPALRYHRAMVHEKEPRVQCDICKRCIEPTIPNRFFPWIPYQSTFKLIHCKTKKFQNKQSIKQHMRIRHLNTPVTCTICGKLFRGKHSLSGHMVLHFTESREKHKCKYCGRGFPSTSKLREHEASHTGLGVYECKTCGRPFRFSSSLSLHRKKCFA